jgi:hypothetical protein
LQSRRRTLSSIPELMLLRVQLRHKIARPLPNCKRKISQFGIQFRGDHIVGKLSRKKR